MPRYRYFDIIMTLFVLALILSNILSSAKIIDLHTHIGPLALVFDAGTLVFPLAYIFDDVLTEVYGYSAARRVTWVGFAALLLTAALVWLAGVLPGESLWQASTGQAAYDHILGGVSGLLVASLVAYFVGEFSNSYVLAKMKLATNGRWVWTRTIGSTLVGEGLDSLTFISIATVLGVFPRDLWAALVVTNYLFKVGIEVVMTPVTLAVIRWLKQAERVDYYDRATDFNPFKVAE